MRFDRVAKSLLLVCLGFTSLPLLADWDVGDPYSMHWPQLPDGSISGIAVEVTRASSTGYILFDDFLSTQAGPVTNIHLWGAQMGDALDPNMAFSLAIYSSQPDGTPGNQLWLQSFAEGEYAVRPSANAVTNWLAPPNTYYAPIPSPIEPVSYVQYNFTIDEPDAFIQTSGTVYWLAIQVQSIGQTYAWNTAEPATRWNNAARWTSGALTNFPSGITQPLRYPLWHSFPTQAMDLAFVIVGGDAPAAETDFGDAPDSSYPTMLADDGARHLLGSGLYLGAAVDTETDAQPNSTATGDDSDGSDDEDGVMLATLVKGRSSLITVIATTGSYLNAWADYNRDGDWADQGEKIFDGQWLGPGSNSLSVAVPASAAVGQTFLRFRASSVSNLSYSGQAPDGEVEDYQAILYQPAPTNAIVISGIALAHGESTATVTWEAISNVVYQLQACTNPAERPYPVWLNIGDGVMGPGHTQSDTNVLHPQKYYRLHVPHTP